MQFLVRLKSKNAIDVIKASCVVVYLFSMVNQAIVEIENGDIDTVNAIEKIDGVLSVTRVPSVREDYLRSVGPYETLEESETGEPLTHWALAMVSNKASEAEYLFDYTGKGVDFYILDSGVRPDHIDFAKSKNYDNPPLETMAGVTGFTWPAQTRPSTSRVYALLCSVGDEYGPSYHGTCVASTAAGLTCGCAPDARIFNVRYNTAEPTYAGTILGLEAIIKHHNFKLANGIKRPSIINSSLGIDTYSRNEYIAVHDAIKACTAAGILHVTSAGNECLDTPEGYPYNWFDVNGDVVYPTIDGHEYTGDQPNALRGEPEVISVGNTADDTITGEGLYGDCLADTSNYGSAIDIFAPGQNSQAAGISSNSEFRIFGGTSSASPRCAGVLAQALESINCPIFNNAKQVLDFQKWFVENWSRDWTPQYTWHLAWDAGQEIHRKYSEEGWHSTGSVSPHKMVYCTGSTIELQDIESGIAVVTVGSNQYGNRTEKLYMTIAANQLQITNDKNVLLATLDSGQEYTNQGLIVQRFKYLGGSTVEIETPKRFYI